MCKILNKATLAASDLKNLIILLWQKLGYFSKSLSLVAFSLEQLQQIATVEIWAERQPPPYAVLLDKVKAIDGLLCLLTDKIDRQLIVAATSLKIISQMAVGYDNIDLTAATTHQLPVGHTPGVLTDATADLTWALLMAAARRIVEADNLTRAGGWQTWEPNLLLGANIAKRGCLRSSLFNSS